MAAGDDLEAELLPCGEVQLSARGLADLLCVPAALLASPSPAPGASSSGGTNGGCDAGNGSSGELALAPGGSGGDAAAGTQLLQRGTQLLAA